MFESTQPCCLAARLPQLVLLLFVEELQQQLDVRAYDIPDATFTQAGAGGRFLVLKVRGWGVEGRVGLCM
jgi:hypothetical protein